MSRHRLFFALVPPDAVRAQLACACADLIARLEPGGRPVRAEGLHVTLAFLGEFARDGSGGEASAPDRARAAASRANAWSTTGSHSPVAPFTLTLDVATSFRGRAPPWTLQPSNAPAALLRLQSLLLRELDASGFTPEDRVFVPHVTFLRNARRALPPTPIAALHWPVADFVLLDSHLADHAYIELGRWPVAPPAEVS